MPESTMTSLMVILGPLLLAVVILWAIARNRRSRGEEARTEAATRANYEREERDDNPKVE